jgi:hypothetical protein
MRSKAGSSVSATRYRSLLAVHGRSVEQMAEELRNDGLGRNELRNISNFLSGISHSASPAVRKILIAYASSILGEKIEQNFFEHVPAFLRFSHEFILHNERYNGLLEANCGVFHVIFLESTDLETVNQGLPLGTPSFRARELRIFAEGNGSFGFDFEMHRRPVRGFAVATHDTIHLIGYEQRHFDGVTHFILMTDPQKIGLQGIALCGTHVSHANATQRIPVKRLVARRVALFRRSGNDPHRLNAAVIDWLKGRGSLRGCSGGLVVEMGGELSEDSD